MSALIIFKRVGERGATARHSIFNHVFYASSCRTFEANKLYAKHQLMVLVGFVEKRKQLTTRR